LTFSFPFPFPFGGGELESLLSRLGGGLGERLGLVEYLRLLGAGLLDTDSDGLRPRRLCGGERDAESAVRLRRFGGGERDRLEEWERLDLSLRGGEGDLERDAELYEPLRARPR
jgi:hypothetical protein